MAQKTEPLAHADELAELWNNLLRCERRALLVLAYADPDLEPRRWQDLPTQPRIHVVRAMHGLTQLAVDCAVVLERAKIALDRGARTPREELQDKIDESAFDGGPEEAQRVRRELADIRSRKRRS